MKVLIFVSDNPNFSLYNPDQFPAYGARVDSKFSLQVGAREGDVFFVEHMGGDVWRVIRRTRYPYSQEQYEILVSPGDGGGQGVTEVDRSFVIPGMGEEIGYGSPFGFGSLKFPDLVLLIVLVLVGAKMLKDEI